MMGTFITNNNELFKDVAQDIIPSCESIDILVGYFYFSGFNILADGLKDKHLRILVGMDVDVTINNCVKEVYCLEKTNASKSEIRENFNKDFIKLFNETDTFDSKEKEQSFRLFISKLQDGTLEIRKTNDPCHAKMYIFNFAEPYTLNGQMKGAVIMGSSNLSYSGLEGRTEINAKFYNENDVKQAREIFEDLWRKSVTIVDKNSFDDFETKVIEKIWYNKPFQPYLMYIRVLAEYFNIGDDKRIIKTPKKINSNYNDFKYQTDAIHLALRSIENHNGVIISDVVGLGKSIIASAVAYNLGLFTIVICPPHLKESWEIYLKDFNISGRVYTSGKIDSAVSFIEQDDRKYLVIVDEAHRYRNNETKDYSDLHRLCIGNKVILLSATPFNNNPNDIYSLLKLFQLPNHSTIKTINNLATSFREIILQYKDLIKSKRAKNIDNKKSEEHTIKMISDKIRSIIAPVCIRRSRLDLLEIPAYKKDLEKQGFEVVLNTEPIVLDYKLGTLSDSYISTLKKIDYDPDNKANNDGKYKAARYSPVNYVKEEKKAELKEKLEKETGVDFDLLVGRQQNLSKFMRRLLVRRFESSVRAFQVSVQSMIDSSETILSWIKNRNAIPIYKKGSLPNIDEWYKEGDAEEDVDTETNNDIDEILESYINEILESYRNKGFFEIEIKYINDEFIEDVKKDLEILRAIQKEWFGDDNVIKDDPKLNQFKTILKDKLQKEPNRKIIVFSEFADTVNYLGEELLKEDLPVMKFTSKDASETNRETIRNNFDAGIAKEKQKDDYKILVATDAISEGYNLHRAGAIFNYDIPYNPTRVIQRVGRINRINKKVFDQLYIYNYFPTAIGAKETRVRDIATLKMKMIHMIMGEDTKVLSKDETDELHNFFKNLYDKELSKSEDKSWDTPYRKFFDSVKDTDDYKRAMQMPFRARTAKLSNNGQYDGVLVFGKRGNDFVFKKAYNTLQTPVDISPEEAFKLLECDKDCKAQNLTEEFYNVYNNVKENLFQNKDSKKSEENINLEAFQKLQNIKEAKALEEYYIDDLANAIQQYGLSVYELKYIKNLGNSQYEDLPEKITPKYLIKILKENKFNDNTKQEIILSEELVKE